MTGATLCSWWQRCGAAHRRGGLERPRSHTFHICPSRLARVCVVQSVSGRLQGRSGDGGSRGFSAQLPGHSAARYVGHRQSEGHPVAASAVAPDSAVARTPILGPEQVKDLVCCFGRLGSLPALQLVRDDVRHITGELLDQSFQLPLGDGRVLEMFDALQHLSLGGVV